MYELIINKKYNQDYIGPAERCVYTFSLTPDQMPGTGWAAQKIVDAHNGELAKQGSRLLEVRMWEDTSPIWTTDYKVEVIATASPLWWNVIILGVLAILIIVAIYFVIVEIENITEYVGGNAGKVGLSVMLIAGIAVAGFLGYAIYKHSKGGVK